MLCDSVRLQILKDKQHVWLLNLVRAFQTASICETEAIDYELTVECLQPHLNLKQLVLQCYWGFQVGFPHLQILAHSS